MPTRIMVCGPKRSIAQPSSGPMMAVSIDCMAEAADSEVLLQPFSSVNTAK